MAAAKILFVCICLVYGVGFKFCPRSCLWCFVSGLCGKRAEGRVFALKCWLKLELA